MFWLKQCNLPVALCHRCQDVDVFGVAIVNDLGTFLTRKDVANNGGIQNRLTSMRMLGVADEKF